MHLALHLTLSPSIRLSVCISIHLCVRVCTYILCIVGIYKALFRKDALFLARLLTHAHTIRRCIAQKVYEQKTTDIAITPPSRSNSLPNNPLSTQISQINCCSKGVVEDELMSVSPPVVCGVFYHGIFYQGRVLLASSSSSS